LSLQMSLVFSGLTTYILAGLYALSLESCALTTSKLPADTSKTAAPETYLPALPQYLVQAPPHLLHTEPAESELAMAYVIPRAGHSHTGRALCAVVAEQSLHH